MINKRGQVTIFIIVAIVIIAVAVLAYFFYPKLTSKLISTSPTSFIQECLENDFEKIVKTISLNGGSYEPKFYAEYYDKDRKKNQVEYLCYTNEYYKTCVVQQPLLQNHIEDEIEKTIKGKVDECFDSLVNSYKKKGYSANLEKNGYEANLLPEKIELSFDYPLTLTKGASNKYEKFEIIIDNNLYELISIANSILEWESNYGDADISGYMNIYHWLKIERSKETGATKIYTLTDRDSDDKFRFASRSVVFPEGYGIGEIF